MKNLRLLLIILMIITGVFGISGCGSNDEGKGNPSGNDFTVETVEIQEEEEFLTINVKMPKLGGFPGADILNDEISTKMDAALAEVKDAASMLADDDRDIGAFLNSSYGYFNNGDIVSLWIYSDNYTGGAHGMYWIDSYTFNTSTGEVYSFRDLFIEDSGGVEFVENKILQAIEDPAEGYFEGAGETVKSYAGDFNYIIDGNTIIVYFPLYDISPYVAGIEEFPFDLDSLREYLKPEIINAMEGQEPADNPYL